MAAVRRPFAPLAYIVCFINCTDKLHKHDSTMTKKLQSGFHYFKSKYISDFCTLSFRLIPNVLVSRLWNEVLIILVA